MSQNNSSPEYDAQRNCEECYLRRIVESKQTERREGWPHNAFIRISCNCIVLFSCTFFSELIFFPLWGRRGRTILGHCQRDLFPDLLPICPVFSELRFYFLRSDNLGGCSFWISHFACFTRQCIVSDCLIDQYSACSVALPSGSIITENNRN